MWKKFCAALLLMLLLPACALAEVVISEIMTSNGTYENGHAYDWIELHNTGKSTVDISGWYLSDSKKNKMKFQFPQGTKLKAAGYLTVFCTGDDEVDVLRDVRAQFVRRKHLSFGRGRQSIAKAEISPAVRLRELRYNR